MQAVSRLSALPDVRSTWVIPPVDVAPVKDKVAAPVFPVRTTVAAEKSGTALEPSVRRQYASA
jgi:hypothetical protein